MKIFYIFYILTFYIFKLVFLFSPFSTRMRCKILFNQCLIFARKNCKQYICIHTYKCNIYIYIYIYIYKYIYIIYIYIYIIYVYGYFLYSFRSLYLIAIYQVELYCPFGYFTFCFIIV